MLDVAKEAGRIFVRARGRVLGAAVAFYAMLSVAPVLVIATFVAGLVTRGDEARDELREQLARWVGAEGASTVGALVERAGQAGGGAVSSAVGVLVLLYSATRLFSAVEHAIDAMWGTTPAQEGDRKERALRQVRKRGVAFVAALLVALFVVLLHGLRAALALASSARDTWYGTEIAVSFVSTAAMFLLLFTTLPSARIGWRQAVEGALMTAVLFILGTNLVGLYLSARDVARTWGEAGAFVVLLLWVHYSAQIFLFGAAFTGVRARAAGTLVMR